MSHRLTFGSVKADCARVLNLNVTDPRVMVYVNRACQSLLYKGRWVGTYARYVCCTSDSCLTWPREIETIEAMAICSSPVTLRNGYYEFLESGPGQLTETSDAVWCGRLAVDRGDACAFDDVVGTGKKIAIYCDGTESGEILLRYYDSNGRKVYSGDVGDREEGELITLPAAGEYAYSTYEVMPGGLYGIIKPVTNRRVLIWQYTTGSGSPGTLKPLAYLEPDETLPVYRRSRVPISVGSGDCTTSKVTVIGKLRFIPAVNDNSYLAIQHPEAIRMACQSILKSDSNNHEEAHRYMYGLRDPSTGKMVDGAVPLLEEQLQHWQGSGNIVPIRVVGTESWGMVQNAI